MFDHIVETNFKIKKEKGSGENCIHYKTNYS
jgi:hypothetical protein